MPDAIMDGKGNAHPMEVQSGGNLMIDNNPLSLEIDYADATTQYIGHSLPGANTGSSTWRIQKLTFSGDGKPTKVQWANGDGLFDKEWDERLTYTYT